MSSYELRADFQQEVLEASHARPILVDFWAEWCGPCRILGPVLEELAAGAGDRWRLVKVDTERHQDLAQRYGIRSIPAVKLFVRGVVVDEFVGALPEAQIRLWLESALGSGNGAANPDDALLEQARSLLRSNPARALQLAEEATDAIDVELRENVMTLARLLTLVAQRRIDELGAPSASRERYVAAARAFLGGQVGQALTGWIELVALDRGFDDDGARKAVVATFQLLGEEDPLTRDYRRRFSAALF